MPARVAGRLDRPPHAGKRGSLIYWGNERYRYDDERNEPAAQIAATSSIFAHGELARRNTMVTTSFELVT